MNLDLSLPIEPWEVCAVDMNHPDGSADGAAGIAVFARWDKNEGLSSLRLTSFASAKKAIEHQTFLSCLLPGTSLWTKDIELKIQNPKDVDAILPFQFERLFPFAPHELHTGRFIVPLPGDKSHVFLFCIKHQVLCQHTELFFQEQLEPQTAIPAPFAFFYFLQTIYPKGRVAGLVLEKNDAFIVICEDRKLIALSFLPITPELYQKPSSLCDVVRRALYTHDESTGGFSKVIIAGSCANDDLLSSFTQSMGWHFSFPLDANLPFTDQQSPQILAHFASCIGLALLRGKTDCNLLTGSCAYKRPWKPFYPQLKLMAFVSFFLAFFIYGMCSFSYTRSFNSLKENYQATITELSENPSKEPISDTKDVALQIAILSQQFQHSQQSYELYPDLPNLSALFTFLATHKDIQLFEKDGKSERFVFIDSLNYKMVKRPTHTNKKDPYTVHVELTFHCDAPRSARSFHDALLANTDFIDHKYALQWNLNAGKGRVTFQLKNRPISPQEGL